MLLLLAPTVLCLLPAFLPAHIDATSCPLTTPCHPLAPCHAAHPTCCTALPLSQARQAMMASLSEEMSYGAMGGYHSGQAGGRGHDDQPSRFRDEDDER